MIDDLIKIYERDLTRLDQEIALFEREEDLWRITGHVKNPAGNLCLHLVGNLRTYIGRNLGAVPYVRDRDAEFSRRDVPKDTLLAMVIETRDIVVSSLQKLRDDDLKRTYPENVLGYEMTTGYFLVHLAAHLAYHTGQINYLRRILE